MKRFAVLVLCLALCVALTGCAVYSSANMARIRSDSVTVLGPWGYVHTGANSAITFYTGRQVASKDAIKENMKIDWPVVPTFQEDSNANLNIGKPSKALPTPKVVTTETTPGIEQAAALISK